MTNGDVSMAAVRLQRGFSYLILLFFMAIMGVVLAMQASLYSFDRQREREADLLRAGREIQRALWDYYRTVPGGSPPSYPPSLDELLEDTRWSPIIKRHLRRIPLDPMTGTHEWGLKQLDGGQIIGVFSTSEKTPIKTDNFEPSEKDFAAATSYQGWEFVGSALAASGTTAVTQSNGTPQGNSGTAPPGSEVPPGSSTPGHGASPGHGAPHQR